MSTKKFWSVVAVFCVVVVALFTACSHSALASSSNEKVWESSLKKIPNSSYEYELAFKLVDEDDASYIYFTPKSQEVGYYYGSYYANFDLGNIKLKINGGELYITSGGEVLVITSVFSIHKAD